MKVTPGAGVQMLPSYQVVVAHISSLRVVIPVFKHLSEIRTLL